MRYKVLADTSRAWVSSDQQVSRGEQGRRIEAHLRADDKVVPRVCNFTSQRLSLREGAPEAFVPGLRDRTLRGMDKHLIEELLEVRISFVRRVVREYVEQAWLKIT
jgi:hypothetical protein